MRNFHNIPYSNDILSDANLEEKSMRKSTTHPIDLYVADFNQYSIPLIQHHWHEKIQFWLVLEGQARFEIAGDTFTLQQGEGVFINSNIIHVSTPDGQQDTQLYTLLFDPSALGGMGGMRLFAGVVMSLAFCVIGFLDDYIKVVKRRNLGLTARQKYLMQLIIGVFYLTMLYLSGDTSTVVVIPFLGQLDLGVLYYPLAIIVITGFVNAVNLTDGIDGLAASVTFVYAAVMLVVAAILQFAPASLMAAALAGGCLGFLVWNFHPAKVFMGDTGSLFLGGLVVALAFEMGLPLLLILTGVVYWCEAFSVMLQVTYFKLTHGKRIFRMSPIHHHFEMGGWSEEKIVCVFSLVALVGGAFGVLSVLLL